ncbi:MAG: sulfatase [Nocardioidaceae bacterium]
MHPGGRAAVAAVVTGAVVTALAVVAAVPSMFGAGADPVDPAPALGFQPNIVLITTDDQTLAEMRWLPKTRRLLGKQGATFTNFVAPHPLCCPSRAQILTGQYAQNNGVRGNSGPYGGYPVFDPETALPVWLQRVGYRTALVGKYLNLYKSSYGEETGWDRWNPTVRGLYQYRHFTQFDEGTLTREVGYHTDYVADRSVRLIEDFSGGSAADEKPFFLWSSFVAPHGMCLPGEDQGTCLVPPRAAPEYRRSFSGVRAPFLDSPSFNEADVSDKPRTVTKQGRVDPAVMQELFTARIRALASVDDAVADIVGALRRSGELERTLIVFTSDNGYLFGEHRYTGKILGYEESVRVPLLMRGPGVPKGVGRDQTAAMIDLAPTFAALAGAAPDVVVDGKSMLPWLQADRDQSGRTLLVQAGIKGLDLSSRGWWFRGVRTDRYTYIVWSATGFAELYDRRRDPYQLNNLAGDARYALIEAELYRRGLDLIVCSGDDCRADYPALGGPEPNA